MTNAQIFHELTGGCWHTFSPKSEDEWATMVCSKCGYTTNDLNAQFEETANEYPNAADILNRMREFCGDKKYLKFINYAFSEYVWRDISEVLLSELLNDYILKPDLLLQKAIEFLEGK